MAAGRVLVVLLVGLLLWTVLFAPTLQRNAQASPVGARRSAALAVLAPIMAMERALGLVHVADAFQEALGRNPNAAPGGDVGPPLPPPSLPPPSTSPGTPGPTPTSTPPMTPAGVAIRDPTARHRLRVVVVGDSLAEGLGPAVANDLRTSVVRVSLEGRISTGLARPDYFDWEAAMRDIVAAFRPDVTIVMIGVNDEQPIIFPGGRVIDYGTARWWSVYRDRVAEMIKVATSQGGKVLWVGLPPMENSLRQVNARMLNGIYRAEAAQNPNAAFFDTWAAVGRSYRPYFADAGGTIQLMRESDGVHFSGAGYAFLAGSLVRWMEGHWGLPHRAAG